MDLIPNGAFRLLKEAEASTGYLPGIYRVITDAKEIGQVVAVLISPDTPVKRPSGRKRLADEKLKKPRKKPPEPLVGDLLWMDRAELLRLAQELLAHPLVIERRTAPELRGRARAEFEKRVLTMASFLDQKRLRESILTYKSLGELARQAEKDANVSRPYVYKNWSLLCRFGLQEESLKPKRDLSGGRGVHRYVDMPTASGAPRKKSGRKTLKQRVAQAYGETLAPEQPGMSSDWAAKIRLADTRIPTPKPAWPARIKEVLSSQFCGRAKEVDGKLLLVKPAFGECPNSAQIKRVLTSDQTRLHLLLDRTTKRHFQRVLRGLTGRNWRDVSGPGHTYAIDSTVGDIYLRSSVDRAWIVGRPIVYIVVDVWSTAIAGFYVCLTGPSWATAKVSLFNTAADPALIGGLWGCQGLTSLAPTPTLPYALQCDRGEYLSKGHRDTAIHLLPMTSYAPPYAGDLKGLVEVLHRIEKDAQFLFIPGAMDYRRKEMELRKVDPSKCTMTVRDYVQYLFELFNLYNLTADRRHRLDAHMQADGVMPSPAGLWHWGHEVGIGYRHFTAEADLVSRLLPTSKGRVRLDSIAFGGCDYMSDQVRDSQWTTLARNFGGWDIDVHHYPGSVSRIWTPNVGGSGLLQLDLSEQARASSELTWDEQADSLALTTMRNARREFDINMESVSALERMKAIRAAAEQQTAEAIAKASGKPPTMTEARIAEVAAATTSGTPSEAKTVEARRDEALDEHDAMMTAILRSGHD
jgi:putative transposase